ncbi:MAG TPA: hypothetical protein VK163_04520 [Opitutaceae bacterium]|nr:hypothetical protein [Opitutaceae bacterium]
MKLPIIINEAGKIYIEAVPQLAWGKGKECTFLGALEAALAVTAAPPAYENLMGWSAVAFRSRWYRGDNGRRWCPSSPIAEAPEELALLRRATGWELPVVCSLDTPGRTPADHVDLIVSEIRSGRPLLAYEPQLNVGVVFGFEDSGRTLLLRDYMTDEPTARIPVEKLGPFLCRLGEHGDSLNPHEALVAGIEQAVGNWHRSHVATPAGRYWYGRAAILKWREDLQHVDQFDATARQLLFFVNWWVFASLADARAAAVRFLRRNSEYLIGRQHRHLLAAADLFGEESRLLRRTLSERSCFLGPWTGRNVEHWTAAGREREVELLGRVLAMETEAFGELENMLEALEVPHSALVASGS